MASSFVADLSSTLISICLVVTAVAGRARGSAGTQGGVPVAAGSSFVTSISEVQRVRLSRSNC